MKPTPLDRTVELVLTGGLAVSAALMLAGLLARRPGLLSLGIVALLLTPVARVVVVTAGLLWRRDWLFALISLWILGVLASSLYVAWAVEAPRARARDAGQGSRP